MAGNHIIFQMPFDENEGSVTAYDYSKSRADAVVNGAHFVTGKNGNAISFGGNDTCEVSKDDVLNLDENFSILAWICGKEAGEGIPEKVIWNLNFDGLNNYIEFPIKVKPGDWFHLAVIRDGNVYRFYVNSIEVYSTEKFGTLKGVSLNQDYYGGDYGFGLLDDVKIYNTALNQIEIINEMVNNKQQSYLLDGIDFKTFGVYISSSDGILNRPKLKAPATLSWDNYHGESVDLFHKFYEPREITLSCFVKAESKIDFIKRVAAFEAQFDKQGTNRLVIDVHPTKPLIYEVYCKDAIEIQKEWSDTQMVGTFKLKLIEPEPVKRVLKHIRRSEETKTCTITLTTSKLVNIYWGDGSVDYDIYGETRTIAHEYTKDGDYFPVVTGCIEEITNFQTNAIVVWERI